MASPIASLEPACRALCARLARPWAADDRFGGVVLTCPTSDQDVLAAVAAGLPTQWKAPDLGKAPQRIRDLAKALGGLNSGQSLLHSDPAGPALLFAAVWPWGDGKTMSVRIACTVEGLSDDQNAAADQELRSWFGLA